jgi:hypothetical protein
MAALEGYKTAMNRKVPSVPQGCGSNELNTMGKFVAGAEIAMFLGKYRRRGGEVHVLQGVDQWVMKG